MTFMIGPLSDAILLFIIMLGGHIYCYVEEEKCKIRQGRFAKKLSDLEEITNSNLYALRMDLDDNVQEVILLCKENRKLTQENHKLLKEQNKLMS